MITKKIKFGAVGDNDYFRCFAGGGGLAKGRGAEEVPDVRRCRISGAAGGWVRWKPRKKPKRRLILMESRPAARRCVTPAESDQFYWPALIDERIHKRISSLTPTPSFVNTFHPSPPRSFIDRPAMRVQCAFFLSFFSPVTFFFSRFHFIFFYFFIFRLQRAIDLLCSAMDGPPIYII